MNDHRDWIQDRAHQLWKDGGGLHGQHHEHWRQAEDEYWNGPGLAKPFEVWINKAEPSVRLVTPMGSGVPADISTRDWTLLGLFEGDAALKKEALQKGFAFFDADEPVPETVNLKAGGANER